MIYSGAGDSGTTTAFGCDQQRISKSSELPEALGALDTLQSFLGLVWVRAREEERIRLIVREIQETLFSIQAEIAGAERRVGEGAIRHVEAQIARIEEEIPPVRGFCVAGGTELSALLDLARTLARTAERRLVALHEREGVPSEVLAYMNRLSSLLFALARLANHLAGVDEVHPQYEEKGSKKS